ncbi:DsbC family protein [Arhodomonas aquaeolei]|uniref:DsbC family protein n=1 Tax=Arhodomonas aquaeolei TaxID=2369 RepID=UPI002167374D|nr:DsbC family protein [Arhodomonas aquaeolei]MCS4503189.1 DsbC family protein [Arhodomonas aquaeolei]
MPRSIALILCGLLAVSTATAETPEQQVRDAVRALAPDATVTRVEETPVDGLYAAVLGGRVVYVTADGDYLLDGELVDVDSGHSLTEDIRRELRLQRLNDLGESRMIVYEPRGEVRHEVTVFTDIDCPYCRRFHRHIRDYLARGIRVRYVFMPRAGRNSASYDKAVSVWCADDRHRALTRAKQGRHVPERQCDNPVDADLRLARAFDVRGTPTFVTDTGQLVTGYRSPDELAALLQSGSDAR